MNKYFCWDPEDGHDGDENAEAVYAYDAEAAGKDFVKQRWSKKYADDGERRFEINVKDEAGNAWIVDVSMDWDPVFYGTVREEEAP